MSDSDPAASLSDINHRIAHAVAVSGRPMGAVTLVAVSKQQPWEAIEPILNAGQSVFGENRVQEAQNRWSGRREGLTLHLIGPLQTNKADDAVALFDVIESLDRPKLALALAKAVQKAGRAPRLYIQVNIGEEPQKAGINPALADDFITTCRTEFGLSVEGLMAVPPAHEPPSPHFALLAKIARRNGLERLSMGMSGDFETAIRLGATSVRVGSALFGFRATSTAV